MEFAIAQAVLDYNVGYQEGSIISDLGEPFTSLHKSYLERNDNIREKLWRKKKKCRQRLMTGVTMLREGFKL